MGWAYVRSPTDGTTRPENEVVSVESAGSRIPRFRPKTLGAVMAWLEPWVMLWCYRRMGHNELPPSVSRVLLERVFSGWGVRLYGHQQQSTDRSKG